MNARFHPLLLMQMVGIWLIEIKFVVIIFQSNLCKGRGLKKR